MLVRRTDPVADLVLARGLRVAILDADFNGPSQARMAGVQEALLVPGSHKVALPRTATCISRMTPKDSMVKAPVTSGENSTGTMSRRW